MQPFAKKQFASEMFLRYAVNAPVVEVKPCVEMDTATRSTLNRDEMEGRRLAAAEELLHGLSQSHISRKYRVSRTTASRWQRALLNKGVDSLKKRRAPGRPSRMNADQLEQTVSIFQDGPLAHGFAGKRWTTAKMAAAIEARFGIHYDPDHVGRLMNKLGLKQPPVGAYASPAYGEGDSFAVTNAA